MDEEKKKKIESAVAQSGFPLEHYIGNILRAHDWRIITNRYYIDDVKNIEREIDILAYKINVDEQEKVLYYTGLIISCKKSEKRTWCFLTRQADVTDVNIDWTPLHFCTSDKRLKYMTEQHRDFFIDKYKSHNAIKHLYQFPESVFAYQQLSTAESSRHGRNVGDYYIDGNEDMYNSIITTIKALETEKHSRIENKSGKNYKKYYSFHLVSVFDGQMVKDYFDDEGKQHIEEVQEIKYLNRHIVNKVDNFYIVNFTTKSNFEYRLKLWDYFHDYNSQILNSAITEFYKDIFSERNKANLLWNAFKEGTLWRIKYSLNQCREDIIFEDVNMQYHDNEGKLELELSATPYIEDEFIDSLNSDKSLTSFVGKKLIDIFRYHGDFYFRNEIFPF